MTKPAAQFVGDIPTYYDAGLGPHLFVDYAADLASRAAASKPKRVLEVAAGTGIVTRMLRDVLPGSSHLIASDLYTPMLTIAKRKFADDAKVEFQTADATELPFDNETFDAMVCQFGIMFFPDKDRSYREAARVLKTSGEYHFNVWDSFEFNAFARITHETVGQFFNQNAPVFYALPFSYHRIDEIKASLVRVGFNDISAHVLKIDKTIPEAHAFAKGLIFGNPIIEEICSRGTADPNEIVAAVATALRRAFGNDPGHMSLQAIVFRAAKSVTGLTTNDGS